VADATGIREYKGAAVQSTLAAGINAASTSFSISPTTNWPTGAGGNFSIVIDQGTSAEESILCSAQATGVITVVTRGYDNTAAVGHSAGAIVTHGPTAIDVSEANYIANTHAQTSKVTPVDADEIGLFDSAATFGLKKLTIANLKALVATYLASFTQVLTNKDLTSPTNTFPAQIVAAKNALINGGADIWQRGTSIALAASSSYTSNYVADRWQVGSLAALEACTVARFATGDTVNLPNIQYALRCQRNSGQTGVGVIYLGQSLESANSIPFAGKTVVLSFYARAGANFSAAANSFASTITTGTGTDQNLFPGYTGSVLNNFTDTLTTTWQRFTHTATLASTTSEIGVYFNYTPTGTAGTNDYFEITGVQLELGSTATTFSKAGGSIGQELSLCQRYYERFSDATAYIGPGFVNGATLIYGLYTMKVEKRALPTFSSSSATALTYFTPSTGTVTGTANSAANLSSTKTAVFQVTGAGMTAGQGGMLGLAAASWFELSSEL